MKHSGYIAEIVSRVIGGRARPKTDGLKQHQREAAIDALLYCLFADDYDDPAERTILDKSIAKFNWESQLSIAEYIQATSERINVAIKSTASEQQFLRDVSRRLENQETRFQVLQMCKILLYSDLFFPDQEVRALAEMSRAFGKLVNK